MKIFWAWQADIPGAISRHFVRGALEEAVDRLKTPPDIEEPSVESRRTDLHLDHDTKDLRGQPEIAHEIFKKIGAANVVVADVTPVGVAKHGKREKPLMNPNVAIELGYAYGALKSDCFLTILNEAFGNTDSLPFDLAHRRHPIRYHLGLNSTKEEIAKAKEKLVNDLVIALRPYLIDGDTAKVTSDFKRATEKNGCAFYFAQDEAVAIWPRDRKPCFMPQESVFYIRVIPRTPLDGNLDVHLLREAARRYGEFDQPGEPFVQEN
jgi:hypothetical protein